MLLRCSGLFYFFSCAALVVGCSSSGGAGVSETSSDEDAGNEVALEPDEAGPTDVGAGDNGVVVGRVYLVRPYHADFRCYDPPTQLGYVDTAADGGLIPCGKTERCYERKDGVVAYAPEDCVHGTNFLANWKASAYSDLTSCEPPKNVNLLIADCPASSCTWARDIVIDTKRNCATAVTTRGCRDKFGTPKKCYCESGTDRVYIAADPASTATPPPSFTPCDASVAACSKALGVVDTVVGCK